MSFQVPHNKNRSVDVHQFAMIPSAEIPRSSFDTQTVHKTTFNSGNLVPIYEDEILPGDSFNLKMQAFVRLATPIVPVMDNLHLDTFFFFVPYRLVWTNFVKMMGEQDNPGDSVSYTVPQKVSPPSGYAVGSLGDYFGLPTVGQVAGANTFTHSALYHRAYALIWNQWFRDENLQNSVVVDKGDGPDTTTSAVILKRGKRKDYFTGALPWPQKGATAVSLPLGISATVKTSATETVTGTQASLTMRHINGTVTGAARMIGIDSNNPANMYESATVGAGSTSNIYPSNLYADLTTATAATINQLRQAFQTQRMLERDARGGTRYTEHVRSHFKVVSPDARLQRAEYLGGNSIPITVSPIPQTTQSGLTGGSTPLGTLGAVGATHGQSGFTQAFTEHGLIIGLASVRADLTYQQGLRRMWSRLTRLDHYLPVFSHLGEQAILNKELYLDGSANDANVFGYQEAWADYRYHPSKITGLFKSTSAGTIDIWHLAQKFTALPTLNDTFITENVPLQRVLAVGAAANGQELIGDFFFNIRKARPMPLYSVPGMIDHF